MTPQELKNSILQLAIQGKLVEQRADEGTGAELLEKIFAAPASAKASVGGKNAEGAKGKGEKSHAKSAKSAKVGSCVSREEIPDDEKPFDIPESWEWVRLGEIGTLTRGSGIKRTETCECGFPCVRYGELYTTYKTRFSVTKSFVSRSLYNNSKKICNGDVVMTLTGENKTDIAIAVVYEGQDEIAMGGDMTCWSHHGMESLYLVYLMNSPYAISCKRELATGDIIVHISNEKLSSIRLPLPPLAEQKRIVAKIEELLPLIDRYEKAWSRLEDFNKRFPVDMQKSLLQMAIQGKLVEQRADEGTGAELLEKIFAAKSAKDAKKAGVKSHAKSAKSAKIGSCVSREEIPDDEKPFEIPESWEWVRHNALFEIVGGSQPPKSKFRDKPQEGYVRLYQIRDYGEKPVPVYVPTKMVSKFTQKGDILLARYGASLGKIFWAEKGAYNVAMAKVVRLYEGGMVDNKYLYYYYRAPLYQTFIKGNTRSAQAGFNKEDLNNLVFPLPPLAEQKRIVAKLEELLPLCERLKR